MQATREAIETNRTGALHAGYVLVRSTIVWTVGILATIIEFIVFLPLMLLGNGDTFHKIATFWGRSLMVICGVKTIMKNNEKLYRDGPVILVSNHQSVFDIPVLYRFVDIQFRWIAKAPLFRVPIIGFVMKKAGYISVDRDDKRKSMQTMFAAAEQIRGGKSVVLFPEGTVSRPDGTMIPFKKGAFLLAKKSGVVIQPVTMWGVNRIAPDDRKHTIQRQHSGTVYTEVLDPIMPEEYENLDLQQLSDLVRGKMEVSLEGLKKDEAADKVA